MRILVLGGGPAGATAALKSVELGAEVTLVERRQVGFLQADRRNGRRQIVGAHVLGEYSAEVIQMVAACMAAGMRVEEVAKLQLAFPTFTEGVGMAAQMLVRDLGIRAMPQIWSALIPESTS